VTNARFATLHVLLVVPVPLSTTPVPLRNPRARHERKSRVGRYALPSALRTTSPLADRRPKPYQAPQNKNVFAVPFGRKNPSDWTKEVGKVSFTSRGFRQPTVRLSVRNRNSPLYPFLYPGTHFCSQKPPALANGQNAETIFNAKGISHFTPEQQTAKSGFLDFQSSALPTELPSQPFIDKHL